MIAELLICGAALGAFDRDAFNQRMEADLKESGCIFRAAVQWSLEKVTKDEAVDLALDCMGVTGYRDGEYDCPCDPIGTLIPAGLPDCPPGEYSMKCPESDMLKRARRLVAKWESEGRLKPKPPTFDPGWGECGYKVVFSRTSPGYRKTDCTERAWPVGVVELNTRTTVGELPVKPNGAIDWELWSTMKPKIAKFIQLACPAGHLTTRKVTAEQRK